MAHCDAWQQQLEKLSSYRVSSLATGFPETPAISTTFVKAERAFRDATRWLPAFSLGKRVDRIFAE